MRKPALLLITLIAPLIVAASNPASEASHVVAKGETLGGIANRTKVPIAVIAAANGLEEPYIVRVGQKLIIPRQHSHTVKPGETGFGIALQYGVPLANIAVANNIPAPYSLRIGQKLIIPAVIPVPATTSDPVAAPRTTPYFRYPHDGAVELGFTMRGDGGGHDGLDFAANTGDMVRASAPGTVIFAGPEPTRFGRLVVIDHGNGWHSAYGHLARVTVARGDVIKGGERIGIAGDAGAATRVEVHFEIRRNGLPVDPAGKLPPRPSQIK